MPPKEDKKDEKDKSSEDKSVTVTIRGKEYTGPQVEQALSYAANKLQDTSNKLDAALAARKDKPDDDDKPAKDRGGKKTDLDDMTQGELAEHLMGQVHKVVKPVADKVSVESEERVRERAQAQIKAAHKDNPDFWEWEAELRSILEKHPDLQVQEAYILARGSDPEKAGKLDGKLKEAKDKEDKDNEPELSGLLPTSGKTSKNTHMNVQDAANAAWEEGGLDRHLRMAGGE